MKETGIIRRMDELGRIVIPKEIRKRMSIENGDLVDIFVYEKQIILKKYHPLNELNSMLGKFSEAVKDAYPYGFLVLDKESIVFSSFDELIGKTVSKDFYMKANDFVGRECPISSLNFGMDIQAAFDLFILPIEKFSDLFGYVIVIDNMITQKHKEFCSIFTKYISSIL